ncbi:syndetin [Citrus sinensis]|uniref:Syndetin n=1 Tax=Citrus sinensis TaxID=2711 RepID=A0ACB8IVF6_CITSI|nr:syndetin [Citrus sinensis]
MHPNPFPFGTIFGNPFLLNEDLTEEAGAGYQSPNVLFLVPFLLFQGGGMDLSKVGEKLLSSVRSARSLGLLPSTSDRPEVPARAAAAAVVARALAGLPPHQRYSLSSSSEELSSIYGSRPQVEVVEDLEEDFYEEVRLTNVSLVYFLFSAFLDDTSEVDFDPVSHILEHIPPEENDLEYFEKQAALRLAQLDRVSELLSRQVMEHHEVMDTNTCSWPVKGMNLVRELEKDLKVANVICMNGRRHITSSINEVSRDLIVNTNSKKKQALLDMLPILTELCHACDMQLALESLVEEGNYCKAFQVLSEYLQLLDSYSQLSAIQEMSRGVEVWLGRTLQKLDSLLLGVCQEFKEEAYINVVDAYALIGDVSGLAEKIQSFFMQEVISETHSVLKSIVLETPNTKQKESDISMSSGEIHQINSDPGNSCNTVGVNGSTSGSVDKKSGSSSMPESATTSSLVDPVQSNLANVESYDQVEAIRDDGSAASSSGSPWYYLRKDATTFVSQTLRRGCKNLWQLTTSRVTVLIFSAAVCSTSIHQFLRNYEDLNVFILAGEAFCGIEAIEFREKLKTVCENYFVAFHRQNIYALKMVLEKETWMKLPADTVQVVSFAGLVGDGAPLIVSSDSSSARVIHSNKSANPTGATSRNSGFSHWLKSGNPFSQKLIYISKGLNSPQLNGAIDGEYDDYFRGDKVTPKSSDKSHMNGTNSVPEEENEDLLADFIDEDSQLPSRISKPNLRRNHSSHWNDDEITSQTGSSLCLLRSMDKYARLMQKLDIVNVEFFKGICQLFEVFFHYVFETFCQQNGKGSTNPLNYRLKTALNKITQDCDEWIKPQLTSFSSSSPSSVANMDVTPTSPRSLSGASFGLKLCMRQSSEDAVDYMIDQDPSLKAERCAAADTVSLVARMLHRSRTRLQSMLLQNTAIEDFYVNLVDSVPDLIEHIHKTTARLLLHIDGYVDRISNAKWEVKELGLEHNGFLEEREGSGMGDTQSSCWAVLIVCTVCCYLKILIGHISIPLRYVDLLLGEFKHYKTRLAHGGIHKEVQDLLLEYGVEIVAETLIEGLSRVKRCTDEGRALMSLDLQVLINGLQHFVPVNVKPKLQIVETFIKAYYLPETEYVHWAAAHPEYTKSQILGLINLVAAMKGWKRKTRLEILEKIESAGA